MRKILWSTALASLYLFASSPLAGQTLHRPLTADYAGLGAYSVNHADMLTCLVNPAALSRLKTTGAALFVERKYLLKELNNYSAVIGLPFSSGGFGLRAMYSGFTEYNETRIGFAYGRKLGSKVDLGAEFSYQGVRINSYGNASAIGFQIGTVFHLTEKLHTGLLVANPAGGRFGHEKNEKLSSLYAVGLGFDASPEFFFGLGIEKEEDQPVNVSAGLQYQFISCLLARAGVSSAASTAYAGIGFILKSFRFDITTHYHPQLGISPGLLVLFNMNKHGEWKSDH